MKKKKTYPPLEEEEGLFASEPALEAYAYPTSSIAEEADIDFNGKDLGLPRTLEEILSLILRKNTQNGSNNPPQES